MAMIRGMDVFGRYDWKTPGRRLMLKEKDSILPKINVKTLNVDPPYAYRSPYLESRVGSQVVTLKFGDRRWEYNVSKKTITEFK